MNFAKNDNICYINDMPQPSDQKDIRIHENFYKELDIMAKKMKIPKKRLVELLVSIGKTLFERTNGMLGLFLDRRLNIKFYFDEDERTELNF